jgi:splicing factor 3B subunit 2
MMDLQDEPENQKSEEKSKEKASEVQKTSKKRRKLEQQMKIFDLKMMAKRPDMVEAWDVTAKDPLFLI